MDGFFSGLVLSDVHQELARNIVSLRISENLFDDLSPDPNEQTAAIHLEMATKPPTYLSNLPAVDRPFEEAEWIDAFVTVPPYNLKLLIPQLAQLLWLFRGLQILLSLIHVKPW